MHIACAGIAARIHGTRMDALSNNRETFHANRFAAGRPLAGDGVMANYLTDCFDEGGTALFLKAIGEVARARGMSELATRTGLTRASLYKALAEDGNPAFDTLARVLDTLGFRLQIIANTPALPPAERR